MNSQVGLGDSDVGANKRTSCVGAMMASHLSLCVAPDTLQTAYIGLGSNQVDPQQQLRRALQTLRDNPKIGVNKVSSLYGSSPVGPPHQPDYVNAVAQIQTALAPLDLLDELQAIERSQGRVRGQRWGPRTLDLDILSYADLRVRSLRLTLPHPRIVARAFVLIPLAEIEPTLTLPGGIRIAELAARCPTTAVWHL